MASCLGLYIDNNIIKYAKVSKEKDNLKVESFGVNFYEKLEDGIKQVIEETYSYKVPISVNLAEENYEYFDMYSLLNKNDLPKAIKKENEAYCGDNDEWKFPAYATRAVDIPKNTRICQFRIFKHQSAVTLVEVEHLFNTDRGGFGSTGEK